MQLQKKTSFLMLAVLLMCFAHIAPSYAQDQSNNCYIGNVEGISDLSFSMEINISNIDTLAGFQIPFSFNFGQYDIVCDSVSFTGGRCEYFDFFDYEIANDLKIVYISGIAKVEFDLDTPYLAPGDGDIATVYFLVSSVDENTDVTFSQTSLPDEYRDYNFLFWNPLAEEVECVFNFENISF